MSVQGNKPEFLPPIALEISGDPLVFGGIRKEILLNKILQLLDSYSRNNEGFVNAVHEFLITDRNNDGCIYTTNDIESILSNDIESILSKLQTHNIPNSHLLDLANYLIFYFEIKDFKTGLGFKLKSIIFEQLSKVTNYEKILDNLNSIISLFNKFSSVDYLSLRNQVLCIQKLYLESFKQYILEKLLPKSQPDIIEKFASAFDRFISHLESAFSVGFEKLQHLQKQLQDFEHLFNCFIKDIHFLTYFTIRSVYEGNIPIDIVQKFGDDTKAKIMHDKIDINPKFQAFLVPARAENPHEGVQILEMSFYLNPEIDQEMLIMRKLYANIPPVVLAEYHTYGQPIGLLVNVPMPYDLEQTFQKLFTLSKSPLDKMRALYIICMELILNDDYRERLFPNVFEPGDIEIIKSILNWKILPEFSAVGVQFLLKFKKFSERAQVFFSNISRQTIISSINNLIMQNFLAAEKSFDLKNTARGAGATLPGSLMEGGKLALAPEGHENLTSGHMITIVLMIESMIKSLQKKFGISDEIALNNFLSKHPIGIIGGGYIGEAIISSITQLYPEAQFIVFDTKQARAKQLVINYKNVKLAASADEVLETASVIAAAPRGKVQLGRANYVKRPIVISDSEPDCLPSDYRIKGIDAIKPLASGNINVGSLLKAMQDSMGKLEDASEKEELAKMIEHLNKLLNEGKLTGILSTNNPILAYSKQTLLNPIHPISPFYSYGIFYPRDAESPKPNYINYENLIFTDQPVNNPGLLNNATFGCELESMLVFLLGPTFANFNSVTGNMISKLKRFGIYDIVAGLVDLDKFQHSGQLTKIQPIDGGANTSLTGNFPNEHVSSLKPLISEPV
jgi:hypothetical protein